VVAVRDGHVAASLAVRVAVIGVFLVCRGHEPAFRLSLGRPDRSPNAAKY
jgi:hypothetical protein